MTISRRRLFQVLAVAPFAPWREILEEAAKPTVAYSIPTTAGVPVRFLYPIIYGKSPVEVAWEALKAAEIQRISLAYGIPPEKLCTFDEWRSAVFAPPRILAAHSIPVTG